MDTDNFETKLKNVFAKGAKVSKDAFSKAGNAVQNFSDKSVLKIEKQQLKGKRSKKFEELGEAVYELLNKDNSIFENIKNLSTSESDFCDLATKITSLQQEISLISTEIVNKDNEIGKES